MAGKTDKAEGQTDFDIVVNRKGDLQFEPAGVVSWVRDNSAYLQALASGQQGGSAKVGVAAVCENEAVVYTTVDIPISELDPASEGHQIANHLIKYVAESDIAKSVEDACRASKPADGFKSKTWYVYDSNRTINEVKVPEGATFERVFKLEGSITCSIQPDGRAYQFGEGPRYIGFRKAQLDVLEEQRLKSGGDKSLLQLLAEDLAKTLAVKTDDLCKSYGAPGTVYEGRVDTGAGKQKE